MLSHVAIENRLKSGEIEIHYYFLPRQGGVEYHPQGLRVNLAEPNSPQANFLRERLFSDRLGLTLGPIVKSHSHSDPFRRPRFRSRKSYTDIRESGGALHLAPHETVSVGSNERIVLGRRTFALILPRITLGDAGILLNVAYIDAFWDGTLQMTITNSTPHIQRLSFLEPIAQCLFFDLPDAVEHRFHDEFPAKSHHYGQNWHKVLDEDAEPFPLRKLPATQLAGLVRARERVNQFWREHQGKVKFAAALLLMALGAKSWSDISEPIREVPNLQKKVERLAPYFDTPSDFNIPAIRRSIEEIKHRLPITGIEAILIPVGQLRGETVVRVDRTISASGFVWTELQHIAARGLTIEASIDGVSSSQTRIRIAVTADAPTASERPISVKWILIP